jgi:xanthine dehydrogenase molybdopterin-binding subunit B
MVKGRVQAMVTVRAKSSAKAKRSVPPSRLRYEDANPAVTVRVSRELRDELARLKEEHGLSLGDVLRIGLDKAKPQLEAARRRGEKKGYADAEEVYKVTYRCAGCGKRHLSITSAQAKEAADRMMYEAGWRSTACR